MKGNLQGGGAIKWDVRHDDVLRRTIFGMEVEEMEGMDLHGRETKNALRNNRHKKDMKGYISSGTGLLPIIHPQEPSQNLLRIPLEQVDVPRRIPPPDRQLRRRFRREIIAVPRRCEQ